VALLSLFFLTSPLILFDVAVAMQMAGTPAASSRMASSFAGSTQKVMLGL